MGAETEVWVQVYKWPPPEWISVSAVTLEDAKREAEQIEGVFLVTNAQYERPNAESETDGR